MDETNEREIGDAFRDPRLTKLVEDIRACDSLSTERAHIRADELLLAYIGDAQVADAFEELDKWYA